MNIIDDSESAILDRLGGGVLPEAISKHIRTCLERCYVAGYHHGRRQCTEVRAQLAQFEERNRDLTVQVALLMDRLEDERPTDPIKR